jgi:DNA-binding GntR family transcriptional regulator
VTYLLRINNCGLRSGIEMADNRKQATSAGIAGKSARRSPAPAVPSKRRKRNVSTAVQDDVTLTDKAYAQIEELIVTLQLPPGTVLSELVLAERLAIGRTPIREALQRLSRDGLVNILPRRGVLVSDIDLRSQLRLLEVRRELERLMARGAAKRATEEERAQFKEIASGMRRAAEKADDISFMRLDQEFNTLVSVTARNEFATRSMGLMHGLSRRFWYQHYKQVADLPLSARLHAEVAEAIAAGNADKAGDASDKLVEYIESFARSTL